MDNIGKYMDLLKELEQDALKGDIQHVLDDNRSKLTAAIAALQDDIKAAMDKHMPAIKQLLIDTEGRVADIEGREPIASDRTWALIIAPMLVECCDAAIGTWLADKMKG